MKAYLKTKSVNDGQFSGEKSVVVENYDGDLLSGFFQNKYIIDGKLEVGAVLQKKELVLIRLPGELFGWNGSTQSYITVKKDNLEFL